MPAAADTGCQLALPATIGGVGGWVNLAPRCLLAACPESGSCPHTALLQARGRILSPAQLHDSLYGFDLDVGSNTVNVHVHHLRRKLGADLIETVRGVGFRLGRSA